MDKQQAVADATATIMQSVRTYTADMANKAAKERIEAQEKAEQDMQENYPEVWNKYILLTEAEKQQLLKDNFTDYRLADEKAQAWGIGGNKSRALNAVTTAITGILGGQTNMQVITNTLAPYASELIGQQFGHGENQNKAAQLLAHALLGAVTASINGGNAISGAAGATAAELAAQYLISQLPKDKYPEAINPLTGEIDPNRLPEDVKSTIRDLSSAVASVAGGVTGGSISNAQIAGVAGMNAIENNNLDILYEEEKKHELELATKYNWTKKQLADYITSKSRASIKGFRDGAVESVEGVVNTIKHPIDTAVGIYDVISHPGAVYNSIIISAKEWNELHEFALRTNPALAGQMEGYLTGKIGGVLTGNLVVTGGAAKIVGSLAKTKYANKVSKSKIGMEWGQGIQKQGMPWEDYVGKGFPADWRLPKNFKTFDYFIPPGRAISVKTLDTTTPAKVKNPQQIYNTLKSQIDAAANFEKYALDRVTITAGMIRSKEIHLSVPTATNKVQWQQIKRAIDYGKSRGVKVTVTGVK